MSGASILTPTLSILCVSRLEPEIHDLLRQLYRQSVQIGAEFCLVVDTIGTNSDTIKLSHRIPIARFVESKGYIESVLDEALTYTHGQYILRIDDDESIPYSLLQWLESESYLISDHWKFPRAHLWPDEEHYITDPPFWPDYQTRLSIREKSGGRVKLHARSPYGEGVLAPYPFYHHRYLVRTPDQRLKTARKYTEIAGRTLSDDFEFIFESYLEEGRSNLAPISRNNLILALTEGDIKSI